METWPSSFPLPDVNLSADNAESSLRTQMDSGRVRQTPRFTDEQFTLNVNWTFTDVQMAVFAGFHKKRLNLGTDWFLITLPLGDGLKECKARFVGGAFKQSHQAVLYWTVSAKLEVEDRPQLDDAVLDVYLEIGFSPAEITNFLSAIDDAYEVTHVTLPSLLL